MAQKYLFIFLSQYCVSCELGLTKVFILLFRCTFCLFSLSSLTFFHFQQKSSKLFKKNVWDFFRRYRRGPSRQKFASQKKLFCKCLDFFLSFLAFVQKCFLWKSPINNRVAEFIFLAFLTKLNFRLDILIYSVLPYTIRFLIISFKNNLSSTSLIIQSSCIYGWPLFHKFFLSAISCKCDLICVFCWKDPLNYPLRRNGYILYDAYQPQITLVFMYIILDSTVVNFINILHAAFSPIFFCQKITKPNCY